MSGSAHHPMSSALSWAAAAWARGGQTGRLRHQGTGRDQRKNPSANLSLWLLWLSACKLGPAYSRLWAQYWESLQTVAQTSPGRELHCLCEPDIEYDQQHHNYPNWHQNYLESSSQRLDPTETCCCFSEVSDSCQQQQQQQQQHLLTLRSPASVKWLVSTHSLHKVTHSVETAVKSWQNAANICQNCASRGKKTCNVCQRIVPWRIVYMFWVLQLGQVDFIYFMFINCLIPKMLETIRARLIKLLIV